MKDIKKYSKKKYSIKFSIWELNAISAARAFNMKDEEFEIFDIDKFFYEFEKEHGILNIVAEDSASYSYS